MSSAYVWNIGQIYTGSTEDLGQIHHAQYAEKDYKLLFNWTWDLDEKRTVVSHEYILVITDADF